MFTFFLLTSTILFSNDPADQHSIVPSAGRLHYETTRRVDQFQAKVTMLDPNGQEIKTDGPSSTVELPNTMSSTLDLLFNGNYAKEEQSGNLQLAGGNVTLMPNSAKKKSTTSSQPVFPTDNKYFDFATRTSTTVTSIAGVDYISPALPTPNPPSNWQDLPQTKKIAGYVCHKATALLDKESCTLWVTTELPFTYSPIPGLTPAQGVVLMISSDKQEFKATKLITDVIAEASVRPNSKAKPITKVELDELRAKSQADMRQRMMDQYTSPASH